jgi:hypothetical protein
MNVPLFIFPNMKRSRQESSPNPAARFPKTFADKAKNITAQRNVGKPACVFFRELSG